MKTHSLNPVASWWPVLLVYLLSYGLFTVAWLVLASIESTYAGPLLSSALLIGWSSTLAVWPRRWWLVAGGLLTALCFHLPPLITMVALGLAGAAFGHPMFSRIPKRVQLGVAAGVGWLIWAAVQWPITSLAGFVSVGSLLLIVIMTPWLPTAARGVQYFSFFPRKVSSHRNQL